MIKTKFFTILINELKILPIELVELVYDYVTFRYYSLSRIEDKNCLCYNEIINQGTNHQVVDLIILFDKIPIKLVNAKAIKKGNYVYIVCFEIFICKYVMFFKYNLLNQAITQVKKIHSRDSIKAAGITINDVIDNTDNMKTILPVKLFITTHKQIQSCDLSKGETHFKRVLYVPMNTRIDFEATNRGIYLLYKSNSTREYFDYKTETLSDFKNVTANINIDRIFDLNQDQLLFINMGGLSHQFNLKTRELKEFVYKVSPMFGYFVPRLIIDNNNSPLLFYKPFSKEDGWRFYYPNLKEKIWDLKMVIYDDIKEILWID